MTAAPDAVSDPATEPRNPLIARRLGIDTRHESVVFLREDSHIVRAEGFAAHARVRVTNGHNSIIATLFHVSSTILHRNEAGLSEEAWKLKA